MGQSSGIAGFFDLFVNPATKTKLEQLCLTEGNEARVEEKTPSLLLSQLKSTGTFERFVNLTKTMGDDDFKNLVDAKENENPFELLKDLEIAEIPSNPNGMSLKFVSKLKKAFKNFDKFFTDIKKAMEASSERIVKNEFSWNKIGYYGFKTLAKFTEYADIALCVLNIITTIEGAREMREKIEQTEIELNQTFTEMNDAKEKGALLMDLQEQLNQGFMDDIKKLNNFLAVYPIRMNDQLPSSFVGRVREMQQKILDDFWSPSVQFPESRDHAIRVTDFMQGVYRSMMLFHKRVYHERQIVQFAKSDVELSQIVSNIKELELTEVLELLAKSVEFSSTPTYDSFPLNCFRTGVANDLASLQRLVNGIALVPEKTKKQIALMVTWYQLDAAKLPSMLSQMGLQCYSGTEFSSTGRLTFVDCSLNDVLSEIANNVLATKDSYQGVDLVPHRTTLPC